MPSFNGWAKRYPNLKRLTVGRRALNVEDNLVFAGGGYDAPAPTWLSDSSISLPAGFYGLSDDAMLSDKVLIYSPTPLTATLSGAAANTFYSVWVVYNRFTGAVGARITAGGSLALPSGFTNKKRLNLDLITDGSTPTPKIRPFYVESGWPNQPKIMYLGTDYRSSPSRHQVFTGGMPINTWTTVNCSGIIPARARAVSAYVWSAEFTGGAGTIDVRPDGMTSITTGRPIQYGNSNPSLYFNWNSAEYVIPVNNARYQMISTDNGFDNMQVVVTGFVL